MSDLKPPSSIDARPRRPAPRARRRNGEAMRRASRPARATSTKLSSSSTPSTAILLSRRAARRARNERKSSAADNMVRSGTKGAILSAQFLGRRRGDASPLAAPTSRLLRHGSAPCYRISHAFPSSSRPLAGRTDAADRARSPVRRRRARRRSISRRRCTRPARARSSPRRAAAWSASCRPRAASGCPFPPRPRTRSPWRSTRCASPASCARRASTSSMPARAPAPGSPITPRGERARAS